VAEVGAPPKVSGPRRRALKAVRSLFSPLLPDDYLELINPLWSTRELRGRIERVERETGDAVTIVIKPGFEWEGHEPGQYLRVGVIVDGVHHWRASSLTSDPSRSDGCICITPKLVEEGTVTPFLVRQAKPGALVRLGGVEGGFVLPDPLPEKLLFISAGSGVTPIMSMLRDLDHRDEIDDAVHIHSARTEDDVIFGERLKRLDSSRDGYVLKLRLTGEEGRLKPADLDDVCPDWRERETFLSGPRAMLDAMKAHWQHAGDPGLLDMERFQPIIGGDEVEAGAGGTVRFRVTDFAADCDGTTPILVAGEQAGGLLPFGCRMGICHTCVGRLQEGRVRDLRTGEVQGEKGQMIRTCVNCPEGHVEIDL
jgi:stearoyl-CoA 9-desaturase NADPH oxidoreductase